MNVVDRAQFIMPKDEEYQCAAISVLQAFVNSFSQKMAQSDVAGVKCAKCGKRRTHRDCCQFCKETKAVPIATYTLVYNHDMPREDWQLYLDAGLQLTSAPAPLSTYDILIDFSDERLDRFKGSNKHVSQVCAMMCGVGAPGLPTLTRKLPRMSDHRWAIVGPWDADRLGIPRHIDTITGHLTTAELIAADSGSYTGFIGYASRATYLAAAIGFPVIEIVPPDRSRNWLSKWINGGYRVVNDPTPEERGVHIQNAMIHAQEDLLVAAQRNAQQGVAV